MNCQPCNTGNHEQCINYFDNQGRPKQEPTETWCFCQHRTGIHLDQATCKHLSYEEGMLFCPSCGKVLNESNGPIAEESPTTPPRQDGGTTTESANVTVLNDSDSVASSQRGNTG